MHEVTTDRATGLRCTEHEHGRTLHATQYSIMHAAEVDAQREHRSVVFALGSLAGGQLVVEKLCGLAMQSGLLGCTLLAWCKNVYCEQEA